MQTPREAGTMFGFDQFDIVAALAALVMLYAVYTVYNLSNTLGDYLRDR